MHWLNYIFKMMATSRKREMSLKSLYSIRSLVTIQTKLSENKLLIRFLKNDSMDVGKNVVAQISSINQF